MFKLWFKKTTNATPVPELKLNIKPVVSKAELWESTLEKAKAAMIQENVEDALKKLVYGENYEEEFNEVEALLENKSMLEAKMDMWKNERKEVPDTLMKQLQYVNKGLGKFKKFRQNGRGYGDFYAAPLDGPDIVKALCKLVEDNDAD